jgi:hypothetical protein
MYATKTTFHNPLERTMLKKLIHSLNYYLSYSITQWPPIKITSSQCRFLLFYYFSLTLYDPPSIFVFCKPPIK